MYLKETKTTLNKAMAVVFDDAHPVFPKLLVSTEYPAQRQDYPSIWTDFEPEGELEQAGIGHVEMVEDVDGKQRATTRWRFGGYATYTCVALSSLERDRLFDEMVRVFAFTYQHPHTRRFREIIEDGERIGMTLGWGKIGQRGFAAVQGTPWDTDETIYEATIAIRCQGEFVVDPENAGLLLLSEIRTLPYTEEEGDPTSGTGWM